MTVLNYLHTCRQIREYSLTYLNYEHINQSLILNTSKFLKRIVKSQNGNKSLHFNH